MYHSNLSPIIYEDVDGQYRGLDQNIHQSEGFTNYTLFSLVGYLSSFTSIIQHHPT